MPHSNFLYKLLEFVIRGVTRKNNNISQMQYILISIQSNFYHHDFCKYKVLFVIEYVLTIDIKMFIDNYFNKICQCNQCRESSYIYFPLGTHVFKIMCNIHSHRVNLIQTTRISLFFNLSLLRIFYNVSLDQAYFLTYFNKRTKKQQISLGTHFECCFANNIILTCHYLSQVITKYFLSL